MAMRPGLTERLLQLSRAIHNPGITSPNTDNPACFSWLIGVSPVVNHRAAARNPSPCIAPVIVTPGSHCDATLHVVSRICTVLLDSSPARLLDSSKLSAVVTVAAFRGSPWLSCLFSLP